jgi:hypothetical protein
MLSFLSYCCYTDLTRVELPELQYTDLAHVELAERPGELETTLHGELGQEDVQLVHLEEAGLDLGHHRLQAS